ncbi:MAG: hypothetical protein ABIJ47_03975 [Candidatus Bathyarchaeota archaeon]
MTRYVPLNHFRRSAGNMFESVDYTFTYYQGCGYDRVFYPCPVCWAQFLPWGTVGHEARLVWEDPEALIPPTIRDAVIFMNSAHDWLAPRIPDQWIRDMIRWMSRQDPSIRFYLQSKFLPRARSFMDELYPLRNRVIMGTTLMTTSQSLLDDTGFKVTPIKDLYGALAFFSDAGFRIRLSLEPLYSFNPGIMADRVRRLRPEVVEVGLDNYLDRHRLPIPQPSRESVRLLLQTLAPLTNTRMVLKKGMKRWLGEPDQPQAEEEAEVW